MKKVEENGQEQFANALPPGRRSGHGLDKVRLSEICLDINFLRNGNTRITVWNFVWEKVVRPGQFANAPLRATNYLLQ